MSTLTMSKLGLFAFHDTGPPDIDDSYTTLVLVHGLAWHAGVFSRLLPLAKQFNVRIVLVNRRGYTGSVPFEEVELREISSIKSNASTTMFIMEDHMKQRAKELYCFLADFVRSEKISVAVRHVCLAPYIRRLVLYDPPYHVLGYVSPATFYNPLFHPSHPPGEGAKLFPSWVSGYYLHGSSASELEHRTALSEPRPTIETISAQDIEASLYSPPAVPGGSDSMLMDYGIEYGLYSTLRKAALFPSASGAVTREVAEGPSSFELRYVWCDQSVWEMPWGAWALKAELEEARKTGREVRTVRLVRLEGANHFAHWDQPARALQALLADDIGEDVPAAPQ